MDYGLRCSDVLTISWFIVQCLKLFWEEEWNWRQCGKQDLNPNLCFLVSIEIWKIKLEAWGLDEEGISISNRRDPNSAFLCVIVALYDRGGKFIGFSVTDKDSKSTEIEPLRIETHYHRQQKVSILILIVFIIIIINNSSNLIVNIITNVVIMSLQGVPDGSSLQDELCAQCRSGPLWQHKPQKSPEGNPTQGFRPRIEMRDKKFYSM